MDFVAQAGSDQWLEMNHVWGANWCITQGPLKGPFSVKLTTLKTGRTLSARDVIPGNWSPKATYTSRLNFFWTPHSTPLKKRTSSYNSFLPVNPVLVLSCLVSWFRFSGNAAVGQQKSCCMKKALSLCFFFFFLVVECLINVVGRCGPLQRGERASLVSCDMIWVV